MSDLPAKITTKRTPTSLELAQKNSQRLMDAIALCSDRDAISVYEATISGDALALGKLILKIDNEYLREQNDD